MDGDALQGLQVESEKKYALSCYHPSIHPSMNDPMLSMTQVFKRFLFPKQLDKIPLPYIIGMG
jgi:hypothetical protein